MNELRQILLTENTAADYLLALAVTAGGVLTVAVVFRRVVFPFLHGLARKTESPRDDELLVRVERSLSRLLLTAAFYLGLTILTLGPGLTRVLHTVAIVFLAFFAIRLASAVAAFAVERHFARTRPGSTAGRAIVPMVSVALWIVGVAFVMDNLGFQVAALLTGLGVGGVAVALAAQAVLGDLFSYVSILFDRPFELGDFIVLDGDHMGTVEHLGIKTTRLRSLGGEQLVIANSDLTGSRVRNYKRMRERRVVISLTLCPTTPLPVVKEMPGIMRSIIEARENVRFERAHFLGPGQSGLGFEAVYIVLSPDMNLNMDLQQDIHLELLEAVGDKGASLALPNRTVLVPGQELPAPAKTIAPKGAAKAKKKS